MTIAWCDLQCLVQSKAARTGLPPILSCWSLLTCLQIAAGGQHGLHKHHHHNHHRHHQHHHHRQATTCAHSSVIPWQHAALHVLCEQRTLSKTLHHSPHTVHLLAATTASTHTRTSPAAVLTRAAPTAAAGAAATTAQVWPGGLLSLLSRFYQAPSLIGHLPSLLAADNGSGGHESAAGKRQRTGPDSSSGEGSGAGPRDDGGPTAMLATAGGGTGLETGCAAGRPPAANAGASAASEAAHAAQPAAAAPAADHRLAQAHGQLQQPQHVPKDPTKLHSPPSSGALQADGAGLPPIKRTRNP